jgi:exodeoxyribonuclease-3
MRLVVWNCQMAFRRKFAAIKALRPDILVISESESPDYLVAKQAVLPWHNHVWIGENPTKGLSVFARRGYGLTLKPTYDPAFRFVAPVEVTGPDGRFDLYAVWTQAEKTLSQGYVMQLLNAVAHYGRDLTDSSLLAGDTNSSPVFQQNGKRHHELVDKLAAFGFDSLYHRFRAEAQGLEKTPTFYLHRNRAKPYHLDYVFCHESRGRGLRVGAAKKWLAMSDHMPLVADF